MPNPAHHRETCVSQKTATGVSPRGIKPKAVIILDESRRANVYGPLQIQELEKFVQIAPRIHTKESILEDPADLAEAEIILGSWNLPVIDAPFLKLAPKLKAIFYAAGSIRYFATEALWERGIRVSACSKEIGITVAEFALGQILVSLKTMWQHNARLRQNKNWERGPFPGIYESTVGLVSLGTVARHLVKLLRNFNVNIIAYDPVILPEQARELGVELCPLEEVFTRSDVVSVHAPWLPQTERMIRGYHLEKMRLNSTLINTSRGAVIAEDEMIEVLRRRPDLYALLDVTHPEPPAADSLLYELPNVLLTPHLAGSNWNECRRLGRMVCDDLQSYLQGRPLVGEITRKMMPYIA